LSDKSVEKLKQLKSRLGSSHLILKA